MKVVDFLREKDQISVSDLVNKMSEFLPEGVEAYSVTYMCSKLIDHLGEYNRYQHQWATEEIASKEIYKECKF